MTYNIINKLASAIHNNIRSGLAGYHTNYSLSIEQLEDAVVDERLYIIKELASKGGISYKDLALSINCIQVDCKSIEKCKCNTETDCDTVMAHFEIPQIMNELGTNAILYLGSTDKQLQFNWYTSPQTTKYRKYKKRAKNKPYVYIDTTPNENGMYDCFVYNAPLLNQISITAIFKDPRQLNNYECCVEQEDDNKSFLNTEIVERLSKKMIYYYRQLHMPVMPNNQEYTQG